MGLGLKKLARLRPAAFRIRAKSVTMVSMNIQLAKETSVKLTEASSQSAHLTAMVGMDGFVDEIIRVVDKRSSATEYTQLERISDLGARIAGASGQSTNMELIVERVKLGGNGPIMANALAALGSAVTCVGPLGAGEIHPAFAEIAERATLINLGAPGHTDALEFDDGKLMLGKLQPLDDVTWERFVERAGADVVERLLTQSSLVALVNWTMIPSMSRIWEKALELLASHKPSGRFFFDLADPEKHDDASVEAACTLLSRFQQYGPTILGLNQKEAFRVAEALGYATKGTDRDDVHAAAKFISKALPIETVVVHPRSYAVTASGGTLTSDVDGPFTAEPKISTGAGDHFNAGFCTGKLLGLSDQQCTMTGVGTSGYYVRNAASPTLAQLAEFLAG